MSNVEDAKSRGSKGNESSCIVPAKNSATSATDQRLHVLGVECRASLEGVKVHFLEVAVRIAEAKRLLTKLGGRGSRFPQWLAEHLPEIEPKTAERWASVANAFGLNADNLSDFRKVSKRIRLTALYKLSMVGASQEARSEAIAAAQNGEIISEARAVELLRKHSITPCVNPENTPRLDHQLETTISPTKVKTAPNSNETTPCVAAKIGATRSISVVVGTSTKDTHRGDTDGGLTESASQVFERCIELPSGTVLLTINHDDFRQALKEALLELDEVPPKSSIT